jgi:hypothetical protein
VNALTRAEQIHRLPTTDRVPTDNRPPPTVTDLEDGRQAEEKFSTDKKSVGRRKYFRQSRKPTLPHRLLPTF